MTSNTDTETETTENDSISRNPGTGVGGFIVGGGYRGKREDQDAGVRELAERLAEEFPEYEIDIRFNTNQLSGGAWLKDTERSAQVGLGVALTAPDWHAEQMERYLWCEDEEKPPGLTTMDPDELELRYTVKLTAPAVEEHRCNRMTDRDDRQSYLHKKFHSVEAAWGYFEFALERDAVNPPAEADSDSNAIEPDDVTITVT